jgi:hypothetical protein
LVYGIVAHWCLTISATKLSHTAPHLTPRVFHLSEASNAPSPQLFLEPPGDIIIEGSISSTIHTRSCHVNIMYQVHILFFFFTRVVKRPFCSNHIVLANSSEFKEQRITFDCEPSNTCDYVSQARSLLQTHFVPA